jgi:hypothetical protein
VAQIVTNIFCTVVLFTVSPKITAQNQLRGIYTDVKLYQEFYRYYDFKRDGSFIFREGASLGDLYYGEGSYRYIQNKLILNYNKTLSKASSYYKSNFWINSDDKIELNFLVKDNKSNGILGALVKIDSLNLETNTDFNGKTSLILRKEKRTITGEVSYLGYDSCKFILDLTKNHLMEVYLNREPIGFPIKNQIDTVLIVKKSRNKFQVRNEDDSITEWKKSIAN